jgi:hypothetical protein
MTLDRHAKLELIVRSTFRKHIVGQLSAAKQPAIVIPGFEIPRGECVELILGPKAGTTIIVIQRSDYVTVYKHTVGVLVGILAHYHRMDDRQVRDALRIASGKLENEEEPQPALDALKLSKRIIADRQAGDVTLVLVTELPEVIQQGKELLANFIPVVSLLRAWIPLGTADGDKKKRKLCQGLDLYCVDTSVDPPTVSPLLEALAKHS